MEIDKVGFRYLFTYFMRCNALFVALMVVIAGVLYFFTKELSTALMFPAVFLGGFIVPVCLHEYMHVYAMRKCNVKTVDISSCLWKVSVKTNEKIQGKKLILVALSGPCVCFLIGVLLLVLWKISELMVIKILAYLFMIHLINIVPPFGDGMMVLKGALSCGDYE